MMMVLGGLVLLMVILCGFDVMVKQNKLSLVGIQISVIMVTTGIVVAIGLMLCGFASFSL